MFTGAEGIKSAAEAAVWGGFAGQQYNPCYHLACDPFANHNDFALEVNSEDINNLRGKGNFPIAPGFSDPRQHTESAE